MNARITPEEYHRGGRARRTADQLMRRNHLMPGQVVGLSRHAGGWRAYVTATRPGEDSRRIVWLVDGTPVLGVWKRRLR